MIVTIKHPEDESLIVRDFLGGVGDDQGDWWEIIRTGHMMENKDLRGEYVRCQCNDPNIHYWRAFHLLGDGRSTVGCSSAEMKAIADGIESLENMQRNDYWDWVRGERFDAYSKEMDFHALAGVKGYIQSTERWTYRVELTWQHCLDLAASIRREIR